MTDVTRRSFVAATGATVAGALAGCTSVTSTGGESTETTDGTTAGATESSPTETATDEATPNAGTTTGGGSDRRTTRGDAHPGTLSIINDTDERKPFTVTVTNDSTGETRTFDRSVAAGKQTEIADVYPVAADGIVTHATTLESDGTVLGEYDVRVFDYHKVHDVTATVTEPGVEWTTVVH